MLDEIHRIHQQVKKIHDGAFGSINIGYPGSMAYGFLPELIASIAKVLPELKIELVEPVDIGIEQLLLNYQMDLGFRREPAINPALKSICLYSEHLALVVPENHPLNEQDFTGLKDLKDEKFILSGLHNKTFYVNALRQLFYDYDFDPHVHIESDFGGMILSLVARGLGISVLPSSYAFSALPNIRFINLPHKVSLYLIWRKEDTSPIVKNILKLVEETAIKFKLDQS